MTDVVDDLIYNALVNAKRQHLADLEAKLASARAKLAALNEELAKLEKDNR